MFEICTCVCVNQVDFWKLKYEFEEARLCLLIEFDRR